MFDRQLALKLKWFCTVASLSLSWRICLHRGGTARPRRWTQTSSALTASRPAGSTVRHVTWWRTATAGWSTCLVGYKYYTSTLTYKDVDAAASVATVRRASTWNVGDKNNPEGTTAFCQWLQKIRYFHTPLNRKTQLSSLCVCAVITAGIRCLLPAFNHRMASQTANWKGVWRIGNIWIWPPLTRTHLYNNCSCLSRQ